MKKILLVFILLIFLKFENDKIQAQNNFSIKYFGLIVHPFGDYSARIQPYKLDRNAYFVVTIGGYVSYEQFIWQDILSLKFKQGLFLDCSAGKSGVTHVSVQMNLLENKKNKLSFSIGPTLIYRESWTRFKEYKNSSFGIYIHQEISVKFNTNLFHMVANLNMIIDLQIKSTYLPILYLDFLLLSHLLLVLNIG